MMDRKHVILEKTNRDVRVMHMRRASKGWTDAARAALFSLTLWP
ncbi:MAG TPA: hypothetical protein PK745_09110 [bacterium]|nr:hypothetical protein [bacterium]